MVVRILLLEDVPYPLGDIPVLYIATPFHVCLFLTRSSTAPFFAISIDVDECTIVEPNDCDDNASCINNVGSYSCKCVSGYSGNGESCESKCILIIEINSLSKMIFV